MDKHIGKRIRELREATGFTPEKFANESEVSYSWLTKAEVGTSGFKLKDSYLQRIADRWECPLDWLKEGKGQMSFKIGEKKVDSIYGQALYATIIAERDKWEAMTNRLMDVLERLSMGKYNAPGSAGAAKEARPAAMVN